MSYPDSVNDQPSYVDSNGTKMWYKNGQLHRENGPAIERTNGDKKWYKNGQLHRDGGPAVERANGTKAWYKNGQLHREDGPAIEWADGTKMWYQNDQLHREDGPAVEYANGTKKWCKNGVEYFPDQSITNESIACQSQRSVVLKPTERGVIEFLWQLLDDIDTVSDVVKDNDVAYRRNVERIQKRRWETGITCDGYKIDIDAALKELKQAN